MVHYFFIGKFNLKNVNIVVIPKDGNGKNIDLKNLLLTNISSKQQRIFIRNRLKRNFVFSFDEFSKGIIRSANPYCKQISQYNLRGKRLRIFPSAKAAAQSLQINETGINAVLKERQVSSGGFVWRYGIEKKIDMESFIQKRKTSHKILVGQKLSQYSAKGQRIATYLTIMDAATASNLNNSDIWSALNGKQNSSGGFIWRKGFGPKRIDLSGCLWGEALRASKKMKKVNQCSINGTWIKTYPSVKAAAQAIGITPSGISTALNKRRTAGGYKWSYI